LINRRTTRLALLPCCFAALALIPAIGSRPDKPPTTKLLSFYAADVWDDDYYPYWQTAIVHVTQQTDGTRLDYTYIASATQPCGAPAVRGRTVTLPHTTPQTLANGLDLCMIDAGTFNQGMARYTKKPESFDTMRSAVVAVCNDSVRVFKMPIFKMNARALKQKEPAAERMSQLFAYLLTKGFPSEKTRAIFWGVDESLSDFPPDSPQVQELKAGQFDKGYWFGFKGVHPAIPAQVVTSVDPSIGSDSDLGKLRNVLARYKQANPQMVDRAGSLADSQGYKLKQFIAPKYPRLAAQTRIEGRVTISLTVNRTTGQVENAEATSGHALLIAAAIDSAKHWQFDSSQNLPAKITAVLNFSLNCGS
jgi:TonB family protein